MNEAYTERDARVSRSYRKAVHPEQVDFPGMIPHPGFGYRVDDHPDMLIERDVAIPVRGGRTLYADIFRPKDQTGLPVLVGYAPFGKHPHIPIEQAFAGSGIPFETLSEFTPWELPDPLAWTKWGYALAVVDGAGSWYSEGEAAFFTESEALAGHDVVEWLAQLEWSNGKVGWGGVSYYAMTAWSVAATNPPHLAAILPWDAASDVYREAYFKAGIPSFPFIHSWMMLTEVGTTRVEDMEAGMRDHPTFDEYWNTRVADFSAVTVPTYTVTEFPNDLHLRGTIRAWEEIASEDKFLEIRGDKEWEGFYSPDAIARQKAFYDHYLKGIDNEVGNWPKVRRAVRTHDDEWGFVEEEQWPPADVEYHPFWLDAASSTLSLEAPNDVAEATYASTDAESSAVFDYRFDETSEIVGPGKLRLWFSTDGTNDGDLFVGVEKLDINGERVRYPFSQMYTDGPLGFGWLRVSHRALDPQKSLPERPVHLHTERHWLSDGEIVPVEVEIWPNSVVFEKGETLRLIVKGTPIRKNSGRFEIVFQPLHNVGNHSLRTGGDYDSHLLLPIKSTLSEFSTDGPR